MNFAHLHLMLNHLPIVGVMIGFLIHISSYVFKNDAYKEVAFGTYIFAAIAASAVFLTGDGAEDVLERLPGINEKLIETHEEFAEILLMFINTLGILALSTFILMKKQKEIYKKLSLFVLAFTLIVILSAAKVANTGGKIRHNEIRTYEDKVEMYQEQGMQSR